MKLGALGVELLPGTVVELNGEGEGHAQGKRMQGHPAGCVELGGAAQAEVRHRGHLGGEEGKDLSVFSFSITTPGDFKLIHLKYACKASKCQL